METIVINNKGRYRGLYYSGEILTCLPGDNISKIKMNLGNNTS